MNWDRIEGSWREFKGKAKAQWGNLTDDDLTTIDGRSTELVGKLQQRYGFTRERAQEEVERWADSLSTGGMTAQATAARDAVQDTAETFRDALAGSVRERPIGTLAIAAVLAFAVGAIWKS